MWLRDCLASEFELLRVLKLSLPLEKHYIIERISDRPRRGECLRYTSRCGTLLVAFTHFLVSLIARNIPLLFGSPVDYFAPGARSQQQG